MSRVRVFEFEDLPWFPNIIRGYMVDYLEFMASGHPQGFKYFADRLKSAMEASHQNHIVDLCSGSSGPIMALLSLMDSMGFHATATLTDLYPNLEAFKRVATQKPDRVAYCSKSINAMNVPKNLRGFRLLSNSFHHFPPDIARKILRDAYVQHEPIAVLEVVERSPLALISIVAITLLLFIFTPLIKPFRLSRLFLTYILPIIPLGILWDGIVSCFRVYSVDELRDFVRDMHQDFQWNIERFPIYGVPVQGTYLIGIPNVSH